MVLLALLCGLQSLKPEALEPALPGMVRIADDVAVRKLSRSTWVFTFLHRLDSGLLYPANGLYVRSQGRGVAIDPGWDARQGEAIARYFSKISPIALVLNTHFHRDRTGGDAYFVSQKIPVYAMPETIRLAALDGQDSSKWLPLTLTAGNLKTFAGLSVLYPGPGHSPENMVVYCAKDHVLFGGCLVKSSTSTTLGDTSASDLKHWPKAIATVCSKFPKARVTVPGHGTVKGDGIRKTMDLLTSQGHPKN